MTVIALLSVSPIIEDSMAEDIATALEAIDEHDVGYETNSVGTVIEANDVDTLLAAVADAHNAIDADRVSTVLQIDDSRTSDESAEQKVTAVEEVLGKEAKKQR